MKKGQKSKKESIHQRVAAIDIGTNSTRFMILECQLDRVRHHLVGKPGKSPQIKVLEQGGEITRLGKELHHTGKLQKSSREATLKTIKKFHEKILSKRVTQMAIFGTSAMREAKNGITFAREIKKATKITVEILKGQKEAELAYEGMVASLPRQIKNPIALDIGGGSTEIVYQNTNKKRTKLSFKMGAVRLYETMEKNLVEALVDCKHAIHREVPFQELRRRPWIGAGGTITTLAAIALGLKKYNPQKVHGHVLEIGKIEELFFKLRTLPLSERKKVAGLEPKRADIIVSGTAILLTLLHLARAPRIRVSDRGILYATCLRLLKK